METETEILEGKQKFQKETKSFGRKPKYKFWKENKNFRRKIKILEGNQNINFGRKTKIGAKEHLFHTITEISAP